MTVSTVSNVTVPFLQPSIKGFQVWGLGRGLTRLTEEPLSKRSVLAGEAKTGWLGLTLLISSFQGLFFSSYLQKEVAKSNTYCCALYAKAENLLVSGLLQNLLGIY